MKQTSSNFAKGLIQIRPSVEDDDRRNGIDGWLDGNIPIAFRKRPTVTIDQYNGRVLTIRIGKARVQGYRKFEYDKLLSGQFRAILYFFKFKGHLIICATQDIRTYLLEHPPGTLEIRSNWTGDTDLICIHPSELNSVLIIPLTLPFIFAETKQWALLNIGLDKSLKIVL